MPEPSLVSLHGVSGAVHTLQPFPPSTDFYEVGAIYAFIDMSIGIFGGTRVLYVGQANNLGRRIKEHHSFGGSWQEAAKLGANTIAAMLVPTQSERDRIERDLIEGYSPPCNKQHNYLAGILEALGVRDKPATNALAGLSMSERDPLINAMLEHRKR